MIDPERLAAFALMTGATSLVPGASMLFVIGETMRRGWRGGAAALAGLQVGYVVWWLLAALGLGAVAAAFPAAFKLLTVLGALYLGWLGIDAIRHAGDPASAVVDTGRSPNRRSFRDGALVALGNPKSLIYMVALLPPFIDARVPVLPQLAVMAVVSLMLDVTVGAIYIAAGQKLAAAMARQSMRIVVNRTIGAIYLAISIGVLVDLAAR
jgi:threonine/homoserine/homoserine lactone efflux protein